MRRLFPLLFAFITLPVFLRAQQHIGHVYDKTSSQPLVNVLITNTRGGALWLSDSTGKMVFTAYPGDVMTFERTGYQPGEARIHDYNGEVLVYLERAPIELKGVEVLSPMARYKRDSAFNRQYFRKTLGYTHSQIGFGGGMPGGFISEAASIITGKKKDAKEFAKHMSLLEEMQFNAIRYTPSLVAAQTGLTDSAAELFIYRNPIPNDFLRVASELELKQRIRDMYRDELKLIDSQKGSNEPVVGKRE